MSKKCDDAMARFLELDKNQTIPMGVTIHLLVCKKCRTQVRLMTMAERTCRAPLRVPATDSDKAIAMLMQRIDPSYTPEAPVSLISMRRWIVCGVAMILAMLFFMFYSGSMANEALSIAFYLIFAVAICGYCAVFIGSNMDFFIKKIETLQESGIIMKN